MHKQPPIRLLIHPITKHTTLNVSSKLPLPCFSSSPIHIKKFHTSITTRRVKKEGGATPTSSSHKKVKEGDIGVFVNKVREDVNTMREFGDSRTAPEYYKLAKSMIEVGNYDGAVDALSHSLKLDIDNVTYYLLRAECLTKVDRRFEAILDLKEAIDREKDNDSKQRDILQQLFDMIPLELNEEYKAYDMLQVLDDLSKTNLSGPHVFAYKSAIHRFLKMPKDALKQINLAVDLGLDIDAAIQYHRGTILSDLGKSEESKKCFEECKRLLGVRNNDAISEQDLKTRIVTITLAELESIDRSTLTSATSTSLTPLQLQEVKSVDEYHELGQKELASSNMQLALEYFTQSIKKNSTHKIESMYRRGVCHYMMGKWPQALEDLNTYAKNNKAAGVAVSKDGTFNAVRGSVNMKLQRYDDAIADLSKALKLSDNKRTKVEAYMNMAHCHLQSQKHAKAIENLDAVANIDPTKKTDLAWLLIRAPALLGVERPQQALLHWSLAINSTNHNLPSIFVDRAEGYLGMGRFEEALADLTKAVELSPDPQTQFSKAVVEKALGRNEIATSTFTIAIEGGHIESYMYRGLCHLELANPLNALDDINKGIALSKEKLNWQWFQRRASVNMALSRWSDVADDWSNAIKLFDTEKSTWHPTTYAQLHKNRGLALLHTTDPHLRAEEAIRDFELAIRFEPRFKESTKKELEASGLTDVSTGVEEFWESLKDDDEE